ncbi:MAG TPA: hypothetical protein VJ935_00210 [Acidimicrobiia bacterium]|nr:hypothetical protein [Acidimicrobiia bacterium]
MQWDLGWQGLGLLVLMALGFGVIAHLLVGRTTARWLWLVAASAYFLSGLFISEVWFGWATQAELQPNIDGLSFDEVLGIALIPGIAAVVIARYVVRRRKRQKHVADAFPHSPPPTGSVMETSKRI